MVIWAGNEGQGYRGEGSATGRLGDLISLERARQGFSAREVAKKCGIGEKYLLEVEAGKRVISDVEARRILKTMGMRQQEESEFTLDDIAVTVDLQTVMPQAVRAAEAAAAKTESGGSNAGVEGSVWLDALKQVLRHVPVYNAVMKEVGHRLLPVSEGRIEGAPADKVYYFSAPDNDMQGFRVHRGDVVLVVPSSAPEDGRIMLVETPQGKALRMVKVLPRFQVMLQRYDQAFEGDIHNLADIRVVGRCVRLEAEL